MFVSDKMMTVKEVEHAVWNREGAKWCKDCDLIGEKIHEIMTDRGL